MLPKKKEKHLRNCVILTMENKVTMVVMEKKDYVQKADELLRQQQTYKTIPAHPTTRQ